MSETVPVEHQQGAWANLPYWGCAFLGAFLLFALEPLITKMALPLYGGSAAVWSAAYLFFTLALLCGYLYVHFLTRRPLLQQVIIHGAVLLLAAVDLPIRTQSHPVCAACAPPLSLLILLIERIGIPFLALSATSPLLQSWWARRTRAQEPYVLFALSNLGSVVALIAYPFLIEPFLGLKVQTLTWMAGYVLFALLQIVIAATLPRTGPQSESGKQSPSQSKARTRETLAPAGQIASDAGLPVGQSRFKIRAEWIAISAVQVLLLLALTNHLSNEIAPVPFIWTLPLALYLLAFVVVFSGLRKLRADKIVTALPFVLLPVLLLLVAHQRVALVPYVVLQLAAFFLFMVGLTVRLASLRPPVAELTEFYVWIATGGALGSIAVAFLAPLFFSTITEYPIAIVLACLLLPAALVSSGWLRKILDVVLGCSLVGAVFLMGLWAPLDGGNITATERLWLAVATGAAFLFFQRRLRFAAALATMFVIGHRLPDERGDVLLHQRNFYGPKQVMEDHGHHFHFLISGTTLHGVQSLETVGEPLAYYSRSGPLGDIFQAGKDRFANREIGVVGMGIGSAACYREPGQRWTFYELDPAIVSIAKDPGLFSVVQTCALDAAILLGDGRLRLSEQTSARYALLILDAYSGDHVPVHLLTREALALYLARTENDGILAFHISNSNFRLAPVLTGLAQDANLQILERTDFDVSPEDRAAGKMVSRWAVMTRQGQMPSALANDPNWHAPESDPKLPLWTDDYSSLARVLRY